MREQVRMQSRMSPQVKVRLSPHDFAAAWHSRKSSCDQFDAKVSDPNVILCRNQSAGMCQIAADGSLLQVNDSFCNMLKISRQAALSRSLFSFIHGSNLAVVFDSFRTLTERPGTFRSLAQVLVNDSALAEAPTFVEMLLSTSIGPVFEAVAVITPSTASIVT